MTTISKVNLAELPHELQLEIMKDLDTKSLCRLSRVSNTLNKVCKDEAIWKCVLQNEFDCEKPELSTNKETAKLLFNRYRKTKYDIENEMMRLPFRCYGPEEDCNELRVDKK